MRLHRPKIPLPICGCRRLPSAHAPLEIGAHWTPRGPQPAPSVDEQPEHAHTHPHSRAQGGLGLGLKRDNTMRVCH